MKRKVTICLLTVILATVLGGCGTDLTEEERKIIAEYAADVLLKYDVNYNAKHNSKDTEENGTATHYEVVDQSAQSVNRSMEIDAITNNSKVQADTSKDRNTQQGDVTGTTNELTTVQKLTPTELGKVLGMDGVDVIYTGMEAGYTYPMSQDNELYFTMKATSGCKLLTLKFELSNITGEEKNCNVVGQDLNFGICFNGTDNISIQKTILLEDLTTLNVVLQPGDKRQAVLVCQVKDGYESTISRIDMVVSNSGNNSNINLQ